MQGVATLPETLEDVAAAQMAEAVATAAAETVQMVADATAVAGADPELPARIHRKAEAREAADTTEDQEIVAGPAAVLVVAQRAAARQRVVAVVAEAGDRRCEY
jgi:hypothetical protein